MRLLTAVLALGAAEVRAQEAAFGVPVAARERVRAMGCGRASADVALALHVADDGAWVMELVKLGLVRVAGALHVADDGAWVIEGPEGELLRGVSERSGRGGRTLRLTPDAAALALLGARIDAVQAGLCAAPRLVLGVAVRRFVAKVNRRGTKVRLAVKVQAELAQGKLAFLTWRGAGPVGPWSPPTTTTTSTSSSTTATVTPTTSSSTTTPSSSTTSVTGVSTSSTTTSSTSSSSSSSTLGTTSTSTSTSTSSSSTTTVPSTTTTSVTGGTSSTTTTTSTATTASTSSSSSTSTSTSSSTSSSTATSTPSSTTTSTSTSTSTTVQCVDVDLGSMTPQSVSATTSGQGDHLSPSAGCFDFGVPPSDGEDVAYRFTAPSSGTFVFDTLAQGFTHDTVLYAWPGCGGPELICNDEFTEPPDGNNGSFIGLELTAGQQVVVVVDSYAASGPFTLGVAGPVAAGNCCAQRAEGGCETPDIEECVCEVDAPCCTSAWDRLCVAEAISFCAVQCG